MRKKNDPVGPFKKTSTPMTKEEKVASTSSRFKSEPTYNYNDAKKRGGDYRLEMTKKRDEFRKDYAKGNMTKSQLRDSVTSTLPTGSGKMAGKVATKQLIGGRSTNKAYTGKQSKPQKGAGKAGPGVNMCKIPKGKTAF
jgi:hypothetical protein